MTPLRFTPRIRLPLFIGLAFVASLRLAFGSQLISSDTSAVPCGLLEEVRGTVQLLDASRTSIREAEKKAPLACGSWITSAGGWARIKLRDGFTLHLGANSFIELTESNTDGKNSGDQAVLYRGEIYAKAEAGSGELRVLTANGRVRIRRGAMTVLYNRESQETQVVALEGAAAIENRFQGSARVAVNAGEASSLSLDLQRVVPASPRAVAIASLREKLASLRVPERASAEAVRQTQQRHDRKIASAIEALDAKPAQGEPRAEPAAAEKVPAPRKGAKAQRKTASVSSRYASHQKRAEDPQLRQHMIERVTGGVDASELRLRKEEETEKRRLIDELSKIREE